MRRKIDPIIYFCRLNSKRRIDGGGTDSRDKKDKRYQIHAAGMFVLYVAREEDIIIISARTRTRVGYIVVTTDHVESRDPPRRPGTARSRLWSAPLSQKAAPLARRGSASPLLPGSTSAQSSGACNAKRDRTHPPFVSALLTIPSSLPPPLLLSRLYPLYTAHLLPSSLFISSSFSSSLLISSFFHFTTLRSLPTALDPTSSAIFTPREMISEDISVATRGIKDNRNPLTRRPILSTLRGCAVTVRSYKSAPNGRVKADADDIKHRGDWLTGFESAGYHCHALLIPSFSFQPVFITSRFAIIYIVES